MKRRPATRIQAHIDTKLDTLCDAWERQLKNNACPNICEFVTQIDRVDRERLLRELVLVQLEYTPPSEHVRLIERYVAQFPGFADTLLPLVFRNEDALLQRAAFPTTGEKSQTHDITLPAQPAAFHDAYARTGQAPSDKAQVIGRYRLLNLVGKGAFGNVFRALDSSLGRIVAIKLPNEPDSATPEEYDRLLREARVACRLDHPGIVKVLEADFHEGIPFLISEYIDGRPLSDAMKDNPPEKRQAVELVASIAEAMEYAHSRQIVHRDLKPSNILIDRDGRPRITDFGLAKQNNDDLTLTIDGKALGTPAYMSPEQAEGGAHHADRRADIYSLGVILYELLTRERPFRGSHTDAVYRMLTEEPEPPSRLCRTVDRDLDTICLKCLERYPKHRYKSAHELSTDLRNWLEGRPVTARPVGPFGKYLRWSRRRPAISLLLLTVIAMLLTGIGMIAWHIEQMNKATETLIWSQVETLQVADSHSVPSLLTTLLPHRSDLQDRVRSELTSGRLSAKAHLRMLLLSETLTSDDLSFLLLQLRNFDLEDLPLVRGTLKQIPDFGTESIRGTFSNPSLTIHERLRAAILLLGVTREETSLDEAFNSHIVELLMSLHVLELNTWLPFFFELEPEICRRVEPRFSTGDHSTLEKAAFILGFYAKADAPRFVGLLLRSNRTQFRTLLAMGRAKSADDSQWATSAVEALRRTQTTVPRQTNQILALAGLVGLEEALPYLTATADGTLRTDLIHFLADTVMPHELLDGIEHTQDAETLYALLLGAGELLPDQLTAKQWDQLFSAVRKHYLDHPDAAVHNASEWLLRHFDRADLCTQLAATLPSPHSDWYTAPGGHVMVAIKDTERRDSARIHLQRDRDTSRLFMAAREVTADQFRQFHPNHKASAKPVSDGAKPALQLSLRDAAAYCNWLSEQEGLPQSEWYYSISGNDVCANPDVHTRLVTGYRLPTPEEWIVACQANTPSKYYFGESEEHLTKYAWCSANAGGAIQPCGSLRPNPNGLFDMYGNALELCLEPHMESGLDTATQFRCLCFGGTVTSSPSGVLPRAYAPMFANYPYELCGFRVVRTLRVPD